MRCWTPGGTYAVYMVACPSDDARRMWLGPCLPEQCVRGSNYLGEVILPPTSGMHDTPVADLAGLFVRILGRQRYQDALSGFRRPDGWRAFVPIELLVYSTGVLSLSDGNHRLAAARDAGSPTIKTWWTFK